ncbi:F26L bisphosphatase, partial [Cepphus grylle]|nr:F26L bisphosphatase [Cepphus grylle]
QQVKLSSPDYKGCAQEEVVADFLQRIECYKATYEPLDEQLDSELSYIKIFDVGVRYGRPHPPLAPASDWAMGKGGAEPREEATPPKGAEPTGQTTHHLKAGGGGRDHYAQALAQFIRSQSIRDLKVWTSHMKRTIETAEALGVPYEQWKALNEIDA